MHNFTNKSMPKLIKVCFFLTYIRFCSYYKIDHKVVHVSLYAVIESQMRVFVIWRDCIIPFNLSAKIIS